MGLIYINPNTHEVTFGADMHQLAGNRIDRLTGAPQGLVPNGPGEAAVRNLARNDAARSLVQRARMDGHEVPADALATLNKQRNDAVDPGTVLGLPMQYNQILGPDLEEVRPPLNAMRLFRRDPRVAPGARTFSVSRLYGHGVAKIYGGDNLKIPRVDISKGSEQWSQHTLITSFAQNMIDGMQNQFAGVDELGGKRSTARRAIDELINGLVWNGDGPNKIYGILNYPDMAKAVSTVTYSMSAAASDMYNDITFWVSWPRLNSRDAFNPNRFVAAPGIAEILNTKIYGDNTGRTVAKVFLDSQATRDVGGIARIESAQELAGIGPNGEDGILIYNDTLDSLSYVLSQEATELAPQFEVMDTMYYVFARFGGVRMTNVGSNILVLVTRT